MVDKLDNAKKKIFITTAIDYVNAYPHLGHCLEKVQADVLARYHRMIGDDVLFLTGTDENSLKNVKAAQKEGVSTEEVVDRNSQRFYDLRSILNLSFDDFIRTTQERHKRGAQKLWEACQGDIYKKKYKGIYCVGCEAFLKEDELVNGLCPEHNVKPELVEEENYFFRLSKYQNILKEIIENNQIRIIPETRKNEVLSFINSGLEDICISRSAQRAHNWGIDVPGDSSQKIWVWFDALPNYINALDYATEGERFQKWWQNNHNILHIIGKGILRFHAVYWPAFLLSAGLNLPKTIFVHGYITINGKKMSKSIGNVIDPSGLVKKYGVDALRYFLLREIPPTEDGDFTYEKFEKRYNSDLVRGLGNLVARVMAMAKKIGLYNPQAKAANCLSEIRDRVNRCQNDYQEAMDNFRFNDALIAVWQLIGFCDRYIEGKKPWQLLSLNRKQEAEKILDGLVSAIAQIANMIKPFLPESSDKILKQIKNGEKEILFPKL